MAWTTVPTYAVGDPWTASAVNTYIRDNLNYLALAGQMHPTGQAHGFGSGATGATGAYVNLGDFGDSSNVYVKAAGSATTVSVWMQPKSSTGKSGLLSANGNAAVTCADVGAAAGLGFYTTTPIAKPTVTGSRSANAALASLLTQLSNLGLLTDSST